MLIICQDGVLPMAGALQSSRVNPRVAITNKIQSAMSEAVTNYGSYFGWQVIPFPKQNALLLNVPVTTGYAQEQYVMNTITGAWAQFQGWNANCWELWNDQLYFGGNAFVGKAWDTQADAGSQINGFIIQAFNDFGAPAQRKRATVMRPYFLTNGSPTIYGSMNWDYDLSDPVTALSITTTSFALWDSAKWDVGIWGGGLNPSNSLQGVSGNGWMGAPLFRMAANGLQVQLVSTDINLEIGGFL
jgi:hypothetical protein